MFFLDFFSFLTHVPYPILLPVLSHKKNETSKEKFVDNERTTKIREKIMALLLLFECMITLDMFLSLPPSLH